MSWQSKTSNFQSLVSNDDKYMYQIKGIDSPTKRDAWWIVRVRPDKLTIFAGLIKKGFLTLTDYGDILDSGFGTEIPADMLKKHGFIS